jgi:hypothetical protein
VFQSLKQWYLALSPRRRTLYSVLISIIVATIPCYCIGGWAVMQGFPRQDTPNAIVATATLEPTPTLLAPTPESTPTQEPMATLEPTPTQGPTATETPMALPTDTETPTATLMPTETATAMPEPSATPTVTATPTSAPTETATPTLTVTPTSTPAISGTISPPPELILAPPSGPAGTEVTISGRYFSPYSPYLLYWDAPEMPIGIILADDIGQIPSVVYTVPLTATVTTHQIVVESDGTVVARAPFAVTDGDSN